MWSGSILADAALVLEENSACRRKVRVRFQDMARNLSLRLMRNGHP
jgi:hypothetical protein